MKISEELPGVAIFCLKEWDIKYQIFPKRDEIQSDLPRALLVPRLWGNPRAWGV